MMKESIGAALILAASVVAAAGRQPLPGHAAAAAHPSNSAVWPAPAGTQEFQYRGLTFTIPASWSVERADQQPFRMQYVTITGRPSGPRLTFSDTVQLIDAGQAPRVQTPDHRSGQRLSFQRLEMPNPMVRGVLYVFPQAGISMTAQVRTAAEARAADAVAESARWSLPQRAPARS